MKKLIIFFILFAHHRSHAAIDFKKDYLKYKSDMEKLKIFDDNQGKSFIISGAILLLGGFFGNEVSNDPTEQLAYSAFQSIGVGSIGYGLYKKNIGDEKRLLFSIVDSTNDLSYEDKYQLLRSYYREKNSRMKQERYIKALTHGLIGALNIYSATKQENDRIKTTMYFLGGVNILASVSFSF